MCVCLNLTSKIWTSNALRSKNTSSNKLGRFCMKYFIDIQNTGECDRHRDRSWPKEVNKTFLKNNNLPYDDESVSVADIRNVIMGAEMRVK